MGQRLNIEIIKDGKVQANAYYHWGAWTFEAMDMVKQCIEAKCDPSNSVHYAIRILESTGAGVNPEDAKFIDFALKPCRGRNNGVISISEEYMECSRNWVDGNVYIDFDKHLVKFEVFNTFNETDFLELVKEQYDFSPLDANDYILLDKNPCEWQTFEEFYKMTNMIQKHQYYKFGDTYLHEIGYN